MEPGELAALVVAISAVIGVVGLLFTLASISRAMAVFRRSMEDITRHTLPLIADTHAAIRQANTDLVKVDSILKTADSISTTVDVASRLAYTAFSSPVMKLLAFGSGTARAVGRLRSRGDRLPDGRATRRELPTRDVPRPELPPGRPTRRERSGRTARAAHRTARRDRATG